MEVVRRQRSVIQGRLSERLELRLDMSQCRLKCGAASRIRRPLRENTLALQTQHLALSFSRGVLGRRYAPVLFAHVAVVGSRSGALQDVCHLLLHRFTFPSTGHIFILRAHRGIASRRMTRVEPERERGFSCAPGKFLRLALILWSLSRGRRPRRGPARSSWECGQFL